MMIQSGRLLPVSDRSIPGFPVHHGNTELVKKFLAGLGEGSGVKQMAWVPYDNHDIRGSLKRVLNLDRTADLLNAIKRSSS